MPWPLLRRCLLFGLLGLVTAVAVAWGAAARWQLRPQTPKHVARGIGVADDAFCRVRVYRGPGINREDWELVDLKAGGPLQEQRLIHAQLLRDIGGAEYEEQMSRFSSRRMARADDLAARGPPARVDDIARGMTSVQWTCAGWPLGALRFSSRMDFKSPGGDEYVLGLVGRRPDPGPTVQSWTYGLLEIPWSKAPAQSSVAFTGTIALPLAPRPGLLGNTIFYALLWAVLLLAPSAVRCRIRRARGRCPMCGYSLTGQAAPGCPECGAGRDMALPLAVN